MTLRGLVIAWITALVTIAALCIVVVFLGQQRTQVRMVQSDAVFLGSSLTRNALPNYQTGGPFPEIGAESALRIGISRGSELELLALAQAAADANVDTVFVEVNPLVSRLANDPVGCGLRNKSVYWHKVLRQAGQFVFQGKDIGSSRAFRDGQTQGPNLNAIQNTFPMRREGPCMLEAWGDVIANAPQTEFVFIEFPREMTANDLIGPRLLVEFHDAADMLSAELNVPLLRLDAFGPWNTAEFLDQSHFNQRGADRFHAELAAWWAVRQ